MSYDYEKNAEICMEIIIESGNAKDLVAKSLESIENFDFETAKIKINEAKKHITKAHGIQTDTIREEMSGESKFEPVLLFNHAQDSLMTVMSEVRMVENLIKVFESFYTKFKY